MSQQALAPDPNPSTSQAERLCSGPIGTEYQMLDLICPVAADMSGRVGDLVAGLPADAAKRRGPLSVFEIGCGTEVTTLALLQSRKNLIIPADNEPAMLNQARGNLSTIVGQGRVRLIEVDALAAKLAAYIVGMIEDFSESRSRPLLRPQIAQPGGLQNEA